MITTMQMRRGLRSDFDPTRLLPGEWAVCIDQQTSNQVIYMCFAAGVVKRMGTYEDFRQQISEATQEIKDSYIAEFNVILDEVEKFAAQTAENKDTVIEVKDTILNTYLPQILSYKTSAENSASAASVSAAAALASEAGAASNAKKSQSYAVGGTGSRTGEDADNAKYYCERAQETANIGPATNDKMGLVKLMNGSCDKPGIYALDAVQANASVVGTIAAQIESMKNELKALQYPIGYIFTWEPVAGSPDLSTPRKVHDYYGIGTWELIRDRMLVGAGGSYGIGSTGGEAVHALTAAEAPVHNHTYSGNTGGNNVDHVHGGNTGTVSADHVHSGGTTVDGYHAHTFSYRWILGVQTGMSGATASCLTNGNEAAHGTSGAGNHNHTFGTGGINANHVHGFTTGGQNTGHVHSYSGATGTTGSGAAHNNMPPYRAVYIWKRIA